MDNKFDIDKMLYLIGQEDAMAELDKVTEHHGFSKKFESEKIKMLKNDEKIKDISNKRSKGNMRKRLIVLIAATTATLAISLTAYGVCQKILFTASRDEESGTVSYDVDSDLEITQIPLINITPGYLPEGYLPLRGAPGKYSPNGEPSSEHGISIDQMDYIYQAKSYHVSGIEETIIGGVKAYIKTSEGMLYKYKIDLIYEEEGQIISITGTGSLEELKKIAENISYEVVPGEFLELYNPEEGITESIEDSEGNMYTAPAVPASKVFDKGEEIEYTPSREGRPLFTIESVEIMDKLPELNPEYFWDYNEYLAAINEDGTLKDYERSVSKKWENNQMNQVTETAGRKFAYVTMTLTNPFDEELKDIGVCPRIEYRKKATDGSLEAFPSDNYGGNDIASGKDPIFFDQSDYSGTHFFFCDLAPKETKEIHLIYLLDEDYINDAYITSSGMRTIIMSTGENIYEFENYVKIK